MTDDGIQPVPTLRELVRDGRRDLVIPTDWNKDLEPTKFHVTAAGHAHLGEIMRHNAAVRIARGEGTWQPPQGRPDIVEKLEDAP